jgi:hypothetical protein
MNIGAWSRSRIIGLSIAWIVLVGGTSTLLALRALNTLPSDDSGLAGISFDLGGLMRMAPVLLVPPACLLVVWAILRKRSIQV